MRIILPALMSDSFGVSDRSTAAIAIVLKGVNIIIKRNHSLAIDKHEVRWEKHKAQNTVQNVQKVAVVKSKYFGGRKDSTKFKTKIGAELYWRTMKKEHSSIIHKSGGLNTQDLNEIKFINTWVIWHLWMALDLK